MPYKIREHPKGGGYQVIKKTNGKVVAGKDKPLTHDGARGYIWHAENSEKGKK